MGKKLNQPIHPIFLEDNYIKKKKGRKKKRETLRFLTQKLLCGEQHGERLLLHRGLGDAHSFLSSAPSCPKSLHPKGGRTTTGSGSSSFAADGEITGISTACLKRQGSLEGVWGCRGAERARLCLGTLQTGWFPKGSNTQHKASLPCPQMIPSRPELRGKSKARGRSCRWRAPG